MKNESANSALYYFDKWKQPLKYILDLYGGCKHLFARVSRILFIYLCIFLLPSGCNDCEPVESEKYDKEAAVTRWERVHDPQGRYLALEELNPPKKMKAAGTGRDFQRYIINRIKPWLGCTPQFGVELKMF